MAQLDHDYAHGKHAHGSPHADHPHGAAAPVSSCCGGGQHGDAGKSKAATAIDPVCGMRIDPATARHRTTYKGQDYFFCSGRCRERFEAEPEKFLQPKQAEPAAPAGTIYTCPMHPEVRQVGPGSCPICGMALEPEQISLDDAPDPELADMTRRFWIALVLTLPVFAIEMGSHLGQIHLVPPAWSNWI
jgi:Cu+-exporting ATPase